MSFRFSRENTDPGTRNMKNDQILDLNLSLFRPKSVNLKWLISLDPSTNMPYFNLPRYYKVQG